MGQAVPYGPMHALQQRRHRQVRDGEVDDSLFLLEHSPVITLGRNTGADHVLVGREELDARGIELHETGRGGDVTYHGPGQCVAYPILHLQPPERDVRAYVWKLEEMLIRTLADWNIEAVRVEGLRGIWVGDEKVAALGVRLSRWTTMHGVALNVSTQLSAFSLIVPCGIADRGITSMQRLLGYSPPMVEVWASLVRHAGEVLGRSPVSTALKDGVSQGQPPISDGGRAGGRSGCLPAVPKSRL